jgi:hypothetical protein
LHGEHVAVLVEEGARVVLAGEIAALPAPIGPRPRHPVEHLARVGLPAGALLHGPLGECPLVRHRAPQPGGDLRLLDALEACRHAGLAEVFLGEDVGSHRAPVFGDREVLALEDDRAVRILDLGGGVAEGDLLVR